MKKALRILSLIIILALTLPFVITGSATATEYVLYKNDTKFSFDEYPAINRDGEVYVPSSFFIGFKNIFYEYSPKYESFYFMNRDTGRYFAFSFNTENIIVDGEYTQKSFPIINSTIYVPLDYCAGLLSLNVEYKKVDSVIHVRLCDGEEVLLFDELLALFAPSTPDDPITDDPITPPDHPTPPDTPIDTKLKSVYLLLEVSSGDIAKKTSDMLRAFGERATVFFDNGTLLESPLEVYNAITAGCGVGVYASGVGEGFENEIKEANNTLEHIANFSTRFYLADTSSPTLNGGYTPCIPMLDFSSYSSTSSSITESIYSDVISHTDSTLKIKVSEENFNTLMALVGRFANDELIELKVLNTSYPEQK